jgi:hypothetical protein
MEERVQRTIDQLRSTYQTHDLEVRLFAAREAFENAYEEIVEGYKPTNLSPFGMFFIPAHGTRDGKPYILVSLSNYHGGPNEDELTHEFSNYDAWKRWGKELNLARVHIGRHANSLLRQYSEVFARSNLPVTEASQFPPEVFDKSLNSLYDTPLSVPTDFVTVEMGYSDRLMHRKNIKLEAWRQDAAKNPYEMDRIFVFNFPYLAYLSFHPTNRKAESELEIGVSNYLQALNRQETLRGIRRLKEYLHDIVVPVNGDNLLTGFLNIEREWIDMWINLHEGTERYWRIFRDIVDKERLPS